MAGAQIPTSVSIIDNLKGYLALSLTEYNTSAAAAIAAGSVVELAGAFFTFASDETPTGWSSIVTATTAYIALTASGTAGSQIVGASYTSTAPTWRDDLQGWYASAASSVRIVASVYKAEATSYYPKSVLAPYQNTKIIDNVYISGIVSVESSLSVSNYPVSTFHDSATALTTILPIGSIVAMRTSGATIYVSASVSPRVASGFEEYFDDSYSPSTGTALIGNWVSRGWCAYSYGVAHSHYYIVQRIS